MIHHTILQIREDFSLFQFLIEEMKESMIKNHYYNDRIDLDSQINLRFAYIDDKRVLTNDTRKSNDLIQYIELSKLMKKIEACNLHKNISLAIKILVDKDDTCEDIFEEYLEQSDFNRIEFVAFL
jgi:hypothetical protein